jgi:carbonic anhydrase/acetyltransferase-like protein (isoleucine patch superfamily)
MSRLTIVMRVRETLGRAFRETGQWLDRLGVQGHQMAITTRVLGDDPLKYEDILSRHRHQMPLLKRGRPIVSPDAAFLAPCSTLIGSVVIGPGSSVFYKAILRADNCENANFNNHNAADDATLNLPQQQEPWELDADRFRREHTTSFGGGIFIGSNTNVQDGVIIDSSKDHTRIGNGVTIGHLAHIHSATVHDHCLIGMGALLSEGVVVHEESFIAAGAVLPRNTVVESGELWVGNPARKLRDLSPEERQRLHYQADQVRLLYYCCVVLCCVVLYCVVVSRLSYPTLLCM